MYLQYFNQKPDPNTVLSCVYNNSCINIKILKNNSAHRLHTLLDFMKKNNIALNKEKILFICNLFDNYRNMKLINDEYNFHNEIDVVRNKKILDMCMKIGMSLGFAIIQSYSSIKNLSEETKNKLKNNKWLITILIFFVISCIIFYLYTYNYMKDEFVYNNEIIKYINSLSNIDNIYLYITNIKDTKPVTLYKAMLDKININHINKYNSIEEYLKNKRELIRQEIMPEEKQEVIQEVMPEEKQEEKQEVIQEVMQEVIPELVPEEKQEAMPEEKQEVIPEEKQEVIPEVKQEVIPEVKQEEKQEAMLEEKQEVMQEQIQEVIPELVPEEKQEKKQRLMPKTTQRKEEKKPKRKYNKKNK